VQVTALRVLLPGNVRHNSGGNAYNASLLRAVAALGVTAESCAVDGDWPVGSAADRRRLGRLLAEHAGVGQVTLVDGLVACGAPEQLEEAADAGSPAWVLLHMPLAGHRDQERRALQAAAGVICTSSTAAAELRAQHGWAGSSGWAGLHGSCGQPGQGSGGPEKIGVALAGTEAAPLAAGSSPPHLLMLAALLPNKDQLLLLRALARITDLAWTATLAGSDTADPAYAALLRLENERLGLAGRVRLPGELRGAGLADEWAGTDLSLLISRAETYGLVVTESLARGVPVIVRHGTGAVEALAAGTPADGERSALPGDAVVLAADPSPLAAVLRRWLTEPAMRAQWRSAARAAREHLPGWDTTARSVLAQLTGSSCRFDA